MNRYFIGFLVAIGLIILLIILLFSGGGKPKIANARSLDSYANTDATVNLSIDGPINAAQEHNAAQITIGRDAVTAEVLQGYDGTVTQTETYANSENSYNAFLHALDHAGFTQGNDAAALKDESGYCPTGDRYVLSLTQDGDTVERYWATNCGGTPKTFNGNLALNLSLFQAQVPNYATFTQNINL